MKKYLIDANFILRYLLKDNLKQFAEVEKYLKLAGDKKIEIKVTSEVAIEIEYVLRKVYKVSRVDIADSLMQFFKSELISLEKKMIFLESFNTYSQSKLDLVDILLFQQAKHEKVILLTFDKGLSKLAKQAL